MSKEIKTPETGLAKKEDKIEVSPSVRFTDRVMQELATSMDGKVEMTNHQKKIVQNSFVKLDLILKASEKKRLAKSEQYRDSLEFSWSNVNINKLAQDIAAISAVGLDPMQKNHVHLVPFKDGDKHNFETIIGYRGTELKALKFGLNPPDDIIVELVYSNDTFVPMKKDRHNEYENYEFKINNAFDRGEIIGGFYYHSFDDFKKNKLVIMPLSEILKRKPDYASAEFWGGEKDEWKDGKKSGKKIEVPGWFPQMCYKTVFRAAHDEITIDSEKITNHLATVIEMENAYLYGEDKPNAQLNSMKDEVKRNSGSGQIINITPVQIDPSEVQFDENNDPGNDENDGRLF